MQTDWFQNFFRQRRTFIDPTQKNCRNSGTLSKLVIRPISAADFPKSKASRAIVILDIAEPQTQGQKASFRRFLQDFAKRCPADQQCFSAQAPPEWCIDSPWEWHPGSWAVKVARQAKPSAVFSISNPPSGPGVHFNFYPHLTRFIDFARK